MAEFASLFSMSTIFLSNWLEILSQCTAKWASIIRVTIVRQQVIQGVVLDNPRPEVLRSCSNSMLSSSIFRRLRGAAHDCQFQPGACSF